MHLRVQPSDRRLLSEVIEIVRAPNHHHVIKTRGYDLHQDHRQPLLGRIVLRYVAYTVKALLPASFPDALAARPR